MFYLHSRLLERAAKINNSDAIAADMNDLPESIKSLVKGGVIDSSANHRNTSW